MGGTMASATSACVGARNPALRNRSSARSRCSRRQLLGLGGAPAGRHASRYARTSSGVAWRGRLRRNSLLGEDVERAGRGVGAPGAGLRLDPGPLPFGRLPQLHELVAGTGDPGCVGRGVRLDRIVVGRQARTRVPRRGHQGLGRASPPGAGAQGQRRCRPGAEFTTRAVDVCHDLRCVLPDRPRRPRL